MPNQAADPTLKYNYANNEEEYVFCVKGRPFPCLVSPLLPTPTSSLVDYGLVRDIGLKMSDLQCAKFSFGGHKMRILGKVSITVQCIHDGVSSGTFHIKGNVVLDLAKNFDTECIAGSKMKCLLMRGQSSTHSPSTGSTSSLPRASPTATPGRPSAPSSPGRPSPPPPGRPSPPPPGRPSPTPPGRPSPTPPGRPSPTPPSSPGRTTPRSPPGFPSTPQHQVQPHHHQPSHNSPHIAVSICGQSSLMSPLAANIQVLQTVFRDADVQPNLIKERLALFECDPDGEIEVDNDGNNNFYLSEGYIYQSGHGREKCSMIQCLNANDVPNNCGFHQQFLFPMWFQSCGPLCRGGFCPCLRSYAV